MSLPLFIYGSLRDPRVRARLLGERADLATRPAVLRGYARLMVPDFDYPFVVPAEPGECVEGELLLGLGAADWRSWTPTRTWATGCTSGSWCGSRRRMAR